jgi:hypothetical protein
MTTFARIALAVLFLSTLALAAYRHGHIVRQHRFNGWPVAAMLLVEVSLIWFAGGWG